MALLTAKRLPQTARRADVVVVAGIALIAAKLILVVPTTIT
jgi:hypothetical protein